MPDSAVAYLMSEAIGDGSGVDHGVERATLPVRFDGVEGFAAWLQADVRHSVFLGAMLLKRHLKGEWLARWIE